MATAGISNMKAADHEYVRAANVANTDDKLGVHGGREERTADTKRTSVAGETRRGVSGRFLPGALLRGFRAGRFLPNFGHKLN
jgi:hypothetical protein